MTDGRLAHPGPVSQRDQRVANDVLCNPEATVERVESASEQRLEAARGADDGGGRHASIEGAHGLARIERVSDDLQATADEFEAREAALRERFQAAAE